MTKTYSSKWLPQDFKFNKYDPIHLHIIEKALKNSLSFVFGDSIKPLYNIYPYPTHLVREDNVIYITKNIKNIDKLLGSMLYRASRTLNDYDINDIYVQCLITIKQTINKSNTETYYLDKILILIHNLLVHNANYVIYKKTPGFKKYVNVYFTSHLSSADAWRQEQSIAPVFVQSNWNTYLSFLLTLNKKHNENDILPELKIIYDEYVSLTGMLTQQEIIDIVVRWFLLLENRTHVENDYSSIMDELESIQKYFDRLQKLIYNNLSTESITPKLYVQKKSVAHSELAQLEYKYNGVSMDVLSLNLNSHIVTSNLFDIFETSSKIINYTNKYIIPKGIAIGKRILSYLQYRDNVAENRINYLKHGILNRKSLYKYAMDDEHIYYNKIDNALKQKTVYLTIDASNSMTSDKWDKLQTFVVSLIYAIDNISSLDLKVFYRMTVINKNKKIKDFKVRPLLIKTFDTNINTFSDVKKLFAYLKPNGGSPEGILIDQINMKNNSILINVSDGKPEYYDYNISYVGNDAIAHSKSVVAKIKKQNIKVISFFIGDDMDFKNNTTIYGKNSYNITKLNQIDTIGMKLNTMLFE